MDAVRIRGLLVHLSMDSPQSLHHPMESTGCDSNDNSLRNMIIAIHRYMAIYMIVKIAKN